MRAFLAAALALVMLAVVGDKPFTFKKDSVMTYADTRTAPDGSENTNNVTWTVGKLDGDKTYVDLDGGKFVFSYTDGFFCWGTVQPDGSENTGLRVFKVDAKKGDTWSPDENAPKEVVMTYAGDEELTVPAGKFMCKKMVLDVQGHLKITFWFADKVGFVKGTKELTLDKDTTLTIARIELQKFVEGK